METKKSDGFWIGFGFSMMTLGMILGCFELFNGGGFWADIGCIVVGTIICLVVGKP